MLAYICLSIVCSASLFIAFGTVVPSQWQRCAIRVAGPCIVVAQYCRYDGKGTGYIVYVSSRYFCVCYIIMYPISVAVKNLKNNAR
mgnify:CR=1 FL=1